MTNSPPLSNEEAPKVMKAAHKSIQYMSVSQRLLAPPAAESDIIPPYDTNDDDEVDFSFDFSLLDDRDMSLIYRIFRVCLAVSALLDFVAVMAHHLDDDEDEEEDELEKRRPRRILFWRPKQVSDQIEEDDFYEPLVEFLVRNAMTFGFVFSALWFINAFIEANRWRVQSLREQDREQLLLSKEGNNIEADDEKGETDQKVGHHILGSKSVYFAVIVTQLLMLPVGFYVFCVSRILRVQDEDAVVEVEHHFEDEDEPDFYEAYSIHANLSLCFALIKYLFVRVTGLLHMSLRQNLKHKGRRLVKTAVVRAVRNPFRFQRRMRKALRAIRWLKYLAPLIGTGNKLKGNVGTLIKRLRQRRETALARRVREQLWDELTEDELRDYCARLIQKSFRAHQRRKLKNALLLFQNCKEQIAATKLQKRFRALLNKARMNLKTKQKELLELREKEKEARKHKEKLDDEERFRLYTLQGELKQKTSYFLNKRLLLRPNTTFAVSWRFLFVFAVVIEITQLALKPSIEKYEDSHGNPLNMTTFLVESLTPRPVSEIPECSPMDINHGWIGFLVQLVNRKNQTSSDTDDTELPWFCDSSVYMHFQTIASILINKLVTDFFGVLGIICFLDVFITFFVGEYNSQTGELQPAPFFQRWILPGICLQLLVNPAMETTYDLVSFVVAGLIRRGPFRVLRWTVAFFFPTYLVAKKYVRNWWLRVVSSENHRAKGVVTLL